jgi:hypothetical protein
MWTARGRTDRLAVGGDAMHPDIIRAIMEEHVRQLSADVRAARRSSRKVRAR